MSATLPVTRADAQTLYALASLARHQPPSKRAAHLVARAEDLAKRIVLEICLDEAAREVKP